MHPSVNAAHKAKATELNVSRGAVYQKLNGIELEVSAALVRETAGEVAQLIEQIGGHSFPLLEGYQVRILEGSVLAATEHRLGVLRSVAGAPLPGKSLVAPTSTTLIADMSLNNSHSEALMFSRLGIASKGYVLHPGYHKDSFLRWMRPILDRTDDSGRKRCTDSLLEFLTAMLPAQQGLVGEEDLT